MFSLVLRFLLTILGRTGRIDDGGIQCGAPADLHPVGGQIRADLCKELFPYLLGFQQMPTLADRALIGYRLAAQINLHELMHGA